MWRPARQEDDDAIVAWCLALYTEDPSLAHPTPDQVRHTLAELRRSPVRGVAAVLELDGRVEGYALLVSFWSNELGGALCEVDEVYVSHAHRSRGHGGALFDAIERGEVWPSPCVAISLLVTPGNSRARALYERLGFEPMGTSMARRVRL